MNLVFILLLVLSLCLLAELTYYFFFFLRISLFKQKNQINKQPPVSVIICAHNEEDNLLQNLPQIINQRYPDFEIIVVDDRSWDGTQDVLKAFSYEHSNLKIVTLTENEIFKGGKKFALTMGIKAAKNDFLVFTDADCVPKSDDWIASLVAARKAHAGIVLGYGGYEKQTGFLNKLIRFDTAFNAINFLGFAKAGLPYMGVGRNLAYHKELFFKQKGFASHQHISSGDDDLFVNQVATKNNVSITLEGKGGTISKPERTLFNWIRQKSRHISTSKHYKLKHKLLLGLFQLTRYTGLTVILILLACEFEPAILLGFILIRILVQLFVLIGALKKLGERDLLFWIPVLELASLLCYPVFITCNVFVKEQRWRTK